MRRIPFVSSQFISFSSYHSILFEFLPFLVSTLSTEERKNNKENCSFSDIVKSWFFSADVFSALLIL